MSNYTVQVSWSGKDALATSDPEKIISGDDMATEFTALQTAVNSKVDTTSGTTTGHTLINPVINTSVSGTAVLDEDTMSSNSNSKLATQQSIKAYADGLKSTSETLTNKTITSPVLNTGVSGSAVLDEDNLASDSATKLATQQSIKAYADGLKSTSETLTNKTLTSPVLNTGVSGSAFLDEDNLASNSSSKLASQQSIKAYADGLKSIEDTLTNKTLTAAILNGVTTFGGDVVSDTDSTDSLGTTGVRWLNVWADKINNVLSPTAQYTSAEATKLSGIEASADVTDATNVTAAGAVMDSELTNIAAVKAINQSLVTSANPNFGNLAATNLDGIVGASTARAGTFAGLTGTVIEATTSLELASGETITGFDATASLGTSNTLVPTQAAVKTYVDNASAASAIWQDVVYLTASDSVYSPSASTNGRFYAVDTSGGAVTVNLPQISATGNAWALGIKKTTSDTNVITVVRHSGDEIDEIAGNVTIGVHNSGRIFLADNGANPDSWTTQQFGAVGGNMTVQNYTVSTHFTAGSTTALTVSSAPASEQNIVVTFDGVTQHHDTYAISGTTVTFSSAIPTGTSNVEIRWGGILAINSPGDGTVTLAKMAANSVDSNQYVDGSIDLAHMSVNSIDSDQYVDGSIDNAHLAANSIDSDNYVDGSIDEDHLANNAVTLAKMAHATDGNLISFNAAGEPAYVATGSANQVLTSAGAGAPPVFADAAGGGAWTLISTQVASGDADLITTGLSTTYASYAVSISNLKPTDNRKAFYIRFGNSSGIVTSTNYRYHNETNNSGSGGYSGGNSASNSLFDIGPDIGNGSGEGLNGMFFIQPGNSSVFPSIIGNSVWSNDDNYAQGGTFIGQYNAALTMDRLQIRFSSGTIASGRLTVWGIAHA